MIALSQLNPLTQPLIKAPTPPLIKAPRFGIEQESVMRRVDLNVGRSPASQLSNFLAQNVNDVSQKRVKRWIRVS